MGHPVRSQVTGRAVSSSLPLKEGRGRGCGLSRIGGLQKWSPEGRAPLFSRLKLRTLPSTVRTSLLSVVTKASEQSHSLPGSDSGLPGAHSWQRQATGHHCRVPGPWAETVGGFVAWLCRTPYPRQWVCVFRVFSYKIEPEVFVVPKANFCLNYLGLPPWLIPQHYGPDKIETLPWDLWLGR